MVERQHKPLGYVQKLYTKYSAEYDVKNTPHNRLKKEQKMIFGFGGETLGIILLYFSFVNITTFSLLTIFGLISLIISIGLIKYSSTLIHSAIK